MKKDILEFINENKNLLEKNQILDKMNEYINLRNNNFKLEEEKINLYFSDEFNIKEEIRKKRKKIHCNKKLNILMNVKNLICIYLE